MTDLSGRARVHAALGEEHRLAIVDALRLSDRTPSDLAELTGIDSNLLAFHLDVLSQAGLVVRRRSEGDARRRYVTLRWERLAAVDQRAKLPAGPVLFVCSRNAARSQMAAALWHARTHREALSAGSEPARDVDRLARTVTRAHGIELLADRPRGYDEVDVEPALVVSVCDRAREGGVPWSAEHLHWSVPDPAGGDRGAYEGAFADVSLRVDRLMRVAGYAA